MKKYLKQLIILFILVFIITFIYKLFIKEKTVNYKVDGFNIKEKFIIERGKHYYYFLVDNKYSFYYEIDLNKRSKIIKHIRKNKDCIYPIYKNKVNGAIICIKDNKGVNYSYLNKINKKILEKTFRKYNFDNYKIDDFYIIKYDNKYYINNINKDNIFVLWNYTGLDIISNDGIKRKKIIDNGDLYDNKYSTLVDRYYVFLDNKRTNKIMYYDVVKDKIKYLKVDETLSGSYNILGVYKNKLYFVDLDNYNEYELDINKKEMNIVGSSELNYIYYVNDEELDVKTSIFKENIDLYKFDRIIEEKGKEYIIYGSNKYYRDGNDFYRSNDLNEDVYTYLFKLKDVTDWKVINNNLLIISKDKLYIYNDLSGLKLIVKNNELKYNYKNIYFMLEDK